MSPDVVRAADLDLTPSDLDAIRSRSGVRSMEELDGYENAVFRSLEPPGIILRFTHTSRRSLSQIQAEAAVLRHLRVGGVSVAAPIGSQPVFLHETVRSGRVVCLLTEAAPGGQRPQAAWDERAIEAYGGLIGRLHRVAAGIIGPIDRPRWDDPVMLTVEHDIGDREPGIVAKSAEVRLRLSNLLASTPVQLIHQDAHLGNLHITDAGEITLFDFDDCAYGPVDYDLAMIVFYWTAGRRAVDPVAETRRLLESFLPAYLREMPDHVPDADVIDAFLTYRELDIYSATVGQGHDDAWAEAFLEGRHERISAGVPYLGVPFAEI